MASAAALKPSATSSQVTSPTSSAAAATVYAKNTFLAPSESSETRSPAKKLRKKSSFMNLLTGGLTSSSNTKRNSNLTANPPDSEEDEEPFIFSRTRGEDLYCPAKPEDLARTVQAVLLQRGLMDPLPIEYNSHLLNVLSEFFKMQKRMQKKQKKWQAVVRHHEWERQEWSLLADDWLVRENRYKAEVKRLELLISKTSDRGVEAVHVARSNSIVDRSGTKTMAARIAKLRENYEETGTSTEKEIYISSQV